MSLTHPTSDDAVLDVLDATLRAHVRRDGIDPQQERSHLRSLAEQEIAPAHITIVSLRGDWDTSVAKSLRAARKGRLAQMSPALASVWPGGGMTWSSAVDIKGMENRFVCVVDIDSVATETELDLLYVALSRPRAGLWVATSPHVKEQLGELFKQHLDGAMDAYKKAAV